MISTKPTARTKKDGRDSISGADGTNKEMVEKFSCFAKMRIFLEEGLRKESIHTHHFLSPLQSPKKNPNHSKLVGIFFAPFIMKKLTP